MLTVYLDTSDYSVLCKDNLSGEMLSIRDKLIELVDKKEIRIGFSYLILFELLQDYSPEFLDDRRRRAKFVSRLCGANCFPFISDLIDGKTFSDEGLWMPRDTLRDFSFSSIQRQLKARILKSTELNREQRRKFANPKVFAEFLKNNPNALKFNISEIEGMPFPESFVEGQYFRKFFLGEISESEADRELRKTVTDPKSFFEFWFQYYKKRNPLEEMLSDGLHKFKSMILTLQSQIEDQRKAESELKTRISEVRHAEKEIKRLGRELGYDIPIGRTKLPKFQNIEEIARNTPPAESLNKYPKDVGNLLKEFMFAYLKPRKFQDSDVADFMHALYIPHCDLWRGDRTFSNLLLESKLDYKFKIVSSLRMLPGRIESALNL